MKTGIECEGIYSGLSTFFITGKEFAEHHNSYLAVKIKESGVQQVYLGADKDPIRPSDYDKVQDLTMCVSPWIVMELEASKINDVPLSLLDSIGIIARVELREQVLKRLNPLHQIKIEDKKHCHFVLVRQLISNELNYLDSKI